MADQAEKYVNSIDICRESNAYLSISSLPGKAPFLHAKKRLWFAIEVVGYPVKFVFPVHHRQQL